MEDSFAVSFFALKMEKTPGFWLSLIRKLFNRTGIKKGLRGILS